jgi:predicted nucleic acid-binding protein
LVSVERMVIVVTDSNVLINLAHINRLDLLDRLPPFSFVVPQEVVKEITNVTQSELVLGAINSGSLKEVQLDSIPELRIYAQLVRTLGSGEAACLALAESRGWLIASDEKRKFYREAMVRLGQDRIINTAGILLKAIRLNVLNVDEADEAKTFLEQRRFTMKFASFRDLLK